MQFRVHGSTAYALLSFCLHLLALAAVFGCFAQVLHLLANELLIAKLASPVSAGVTLARQTALGFLALLVVVVAIALLLRNAIRVHRDASMKLQICWNDEGHIKVHLDNKVTSLPLSTHQWHNCVLAPGCYSTHWAVVLALYSDDSTQARPGGGRFCILLMRDAVTNETFRRLRLWMHLVAPNQLAARSRGI